MAENSMYSSWADRISMVIIAALLGFMFTQLWNLQSAISATATKLGELTVFSSETLNNTRQLIQQGVTIAQVTIEQLRALENRVTAIERSGSQVAQDSHDHVESLEVRLRKLEDFVTAHGNLYQQDYEQMNKRLNKMEKSKK